MTSASLRQAWRYDVGGLEVRCRFAIRGLSKSVPAGSGCGDIAVSLDRGHGPVPEQRIFQWPGRYGLCLWRTGDAWQFTSARDGSFLVNDGGSSIRCFGAGDGARRRRPTAGLQHVLARRVLPRVGLLHGRVGLHAATVGDGDGAVIFAGRSYAGKSTLSAALQQRFGWQLFGDDISLIEAGERTTRCFRVGTGASLRPDALAALQIPLTVPRSIPDHDDKWWCAADVPGAVTAAPVRAIVFLERDGGDTPGGIRISSLSPSRAVIKAMGQQVLFDPSDRAALGPSMTKLARVMEGVPAYDLSYPRSFDLLPAVADRVRECLDAAPP